MNAQHFIRLEWEKANTLSVRAKTHSDEKKKKELELEFCLHGTIKHQVEEPLLSVNMLAPGLSKQFLWVSKVLCIGLLSQLKNRLRVSVVPQLTLQHQF